MRVKKGFWKYVDFIWLQILHICMYNVDTLYNNSGQINLRDFGNDEFTKRPNRLIRKFLRNFSLAQKHFFSKSTK